MTAIFQSIMSNLFEIFVLGAVAIAGVICGHKFRSYRDAKKAAGSSGKDTK